MQTWKISPMIVLLMAVLVIVGVAIVVAASPSWPNVQATQMGSTPPPGTATSQATANPTQVIPSATSEAVSPTMPPPDQTPHPTVEVIVGPSVVAIGTYVPVGPTPNATEVTNANLSDYLVSKLYKEPATLIAQGTNTTPIPDEFYTDLALITYEVHKIDLPEEVTWQALLPAEQGGLELRSVTFNEAWRVTVKGTGFFDGNSGWIMYAGDQVLGIANFTNAGLTAIVYDPSLLSEGAKLGISFGGSSITYLQEPLHFPHGP